MTSVLHTNGDFLETATIPTGTGDWTIYGWFKANSGEYGGAGEHVLFAWGIDGGSSEGVMLNVGFTSNAILTALYFRNGGANIDSQDLLTGSDTTWTHFVFQHTAGSADVICKLRKEGVATYTSHTLNNGAQVAFTGASLFIGSSQFAEHALNSASRHFLVEASVLSDATLLTRSGLTYSPSNSPQHFLDLDSPTNANVNGGTGGNWTTTGTLTSEASEPTESFSGPGTPSLSPLDNATGVSRTANLTLTFAENVQAVSGNITIKKTSDNSTVETISVTDGSKVTFASNVVTVDPATTLDYGVEYYVLVDSGAIESAVDAEDWAGISSTTAWSFTTRTGRVVLEASGTTVYSATGTPTSIAVPWPTTPVPAGTDGKIVLLVAGKPATSGAMTVTTPSSPWVLVGSITAAGGYTVGGASAAETGNCDYYVYERDDPGTTSGTLSVTINVGTTSGVAFGKMIRLSKDSGSWSVGLATGQRSASPNGSVSITFGSDPGVTAEDYVIVGFAIPTDITTPIQFSAEALSQTGVTFGTVSELEEQDTGNNLDMGGVIAHARATAGTSSAAPTFTATAGGTTTNVRGPAVFVRIRAASAAAVDSFPFGAAALRVARNTLLRM